MRTYGFCSSQSSDLIKNLLQEVAEQEHISRYIVRLEIEHLQDTVSHVHQEEWLFRKLLPLLYNLRTLLLKGHNFSMYYRCPLGTTSTISPLLSRLHKVRVGFESFRDSSDLKPLQMLSNVPSLRVLSATDAKSTNFSS